MPLPIASSMTLLKPSISSLPACTPLAVVSPTLLKTVLPKRIFCGEMKNGTVLSEEAFILLATGWMRVPGLKMSGSPMRISSRRSPP